MKRVKLTIHGLSPHCKTVADVLSKIHGWTVSTPERVEEGFKFTLTKVLDDSDNDWYVQALEVTKSVWRAAQTYIQADVECLDAYTFTTGSWLGFIMSEFGWTAVRRFPDGVLRYNKTTSDETADGWEPVPGAPIIKEEDMP